MHRRIRTKSRISVVLTGLLIWITVFALQPHSQVAAIGNWPNAPFGIPATGYVGLLYKQPYPQPAQGIHAGLDICRFQGCPEDLQSKGPGNEVRAAYGGTVKAIYSKDVRSKVPATDPQAVIVVMEHTEVVVPTLARRGSRQPARMNAPAGPIYSWYLHMADEFSNTSFVNPQLMEGQYYPMGSLLGYVGNRLILDRTGTPIGDIVSHLHFQVQTTHLNILLGDGNCGTDSACDPSPFIGPNVNWTEPNPPPLRYGDPISSNVSAPAPTPTGTLAPISTTGRLYAVNQEGNRLSAIDPGTLRVVGTAISAYPVELAVNRASTRIYVGALAGASVDVFDGATLARITQVSLNSSPMALALHPDGSRLYVSTWPAYVIDTTTNSVITTIPVPGYSGIAVNSAGTRVYMTYAESFDPSTRGLAVIDTANNSVLSRWLTDDSPNYLAISPDGARLYVTTQNRMFIVDAVTGSKLATISTFGCPGNLASNPNGTRIYVLYWADCGSYARGHVGVIDASGQLIATVDLQGSAGLGIAVSADGTRVYAARGGYVAVVDAVANSLVGAVAIGGSVRGVAVGR